MDNRRALLLGLAAVLLWSTVATAFKLTLRYLDVYQMLLYASISSALVLLLMVAIRGHLKDLVSLFKHDPRHFLLAALLNPCAYYLILFSAYDRLPAQQAQAINYTWAITLALMAVPLLGQSLRWRDVLAALMGYSGVLVIATRGDVLSLRFDSSTGVALALLSTLVWAYYWIINTRLQQDAVTGMCLKFLLSVPVCLVLCLMFSSLGPLPWQGLLGAGYIGLFEMGITFVLWSAALMSASRVARVSNLIFLAPLLSLIFIQSILGEPIVAATLVGLALIIPGALIQQLHSE
jgi:drug/metabolite transporter (DMT)-like permease